MAQRNNFYLYISSDPTNIYSHNKPSHFQYIFPKTMKFDENWSISIIQKNTGLNQRHFITSNVCSDSFVGNKTLQMLGTFESDQIDNNYYVQMKTQTTQTLVFNILDETLKPVELENNINLLLHFKKQYI